MQTRLPATTKALLLGLAAGLAACAAGIALASALLPEWRAADPGDPAVYQAAYRDLAARAGFVLAAGEPRTFLVTDARRPYDVFHATEARSSRRPLARQTAIRVGVVQSVRGPQSWPAGNLGLELSFDGRPERLSWWSHSRNPFDLPRAGEAIRFAEQVAPLLLHAGESFGPRRLEYFAGSPTLLLPIRGASPPQHLVAVAAHPVTAGRRPGRLTDAAAAEVDAGVTRMLGRMFLNLLGFLLLLGLFVILALKSRLSVVNGALLALLALLTLNPAPTTAAGSTGWCLLMTAGAEVWIFLLWSSAESLLRSTDASFTTSLDALRAARLGPRGGRALLVGFGFGAALAGLRLALASLAAAVPGLRLAAPSVSLPLFSSLGSPVADGIRLAAGVALALALAYRAVPIRWAPAAAAVAAGAVLPLLTVQPWAAELAGGVLVAGVLVRVTRRHGLTALLTAGVVSGLLPAAVFSARHLGWMTGACAATALPCAAVVLLGWLGLTRPGGAEVRYLSPPAFVRRLEEERRLKSEMSLLARMQGALLPRTLPAVGGWELAARSVIANEAGGDLYDVLRDEEGYLWIAAGDVAGHGYSCAIAQAMTKAALASLIGRERTPSEVLRRMDRVLRAAGTQRNFTSLALLRLRPETGEAVLGNAAYPYPLLAAEGEVREIAGSSLPLGQGPPRRYADEALRLPPGGALVFCSDGLFEAADGEETFYGYERARRILRLAAGRNAGAILEALLTDWRHFLHGVQPLDDTTVLVLKRTAEPVP
jgi:hypothetical protein